MHDGVIYYEDQTALSCFYWQAILFFQERRKIWITKYFDKDSGLRRKMTQSFKIYGLNINLEWLSRGTGIRSVTSNFPCSRLRTSHFRGSA